MIMRNPLLRADVAEYRALLTIVSTHGYFINQSAVEKQSLSWDFFRSLFSRAN